MSGQNGTELGKPSLAPSASYGMGKVPSYKETKSEEVGRVADEAAVLMMLR